LQGKQTIQVTWMVYMFIQNCTVKPVSKGNVKMCPLWTVVLCMQVNILCTIH